jgi:hypothetical protein
LFAVAVVGVAVIVGSRAYLAQRLYSQFFADDFLYLQLARDGSFTPSWLAVNSYGHFAPGNRLLYLATQRTVGLDYNLAALVPSVLVVTIFLSLTWLVRELTGDRAVPIAVGVLGATSVPVMSTMLWFGAGNHVLSGAATMTLCVTAFVVYLRREQERYRVVSVLALSAGLFMQERPIITIGYLVLVRYLFHIRLARAFARPRAILREIAFWLPWVVVEAVYLVYRLFIFDGAPQPGKASDAAEFIGLSVLRGWAPSLVGVRLSPASPLLTASVVAGLLLFIAVSILLIRRRLQAWRALGFLAAIYLANMGIVAVGRLNVADLRALATDLQYYVDVHVGTIVAFVLGFTLLPSRPRRARRRGAPTTTFRVGVPALAVFALVVSTAVTAHGVLTSNNESHAHQYLNRAQSDLHARPGPFALMRTKLPVLVAPSFIDPFTDVPAVFALDDSVADRLDPTSETRIAILVDGSVVPVHPSTEFELSAPAPAITAGLGVVDNTDRGACLSGTDAYYKVRLRQPLDGPGYFFAVTYTSVEDRDLAASVQDDEQTAYNWVPTSLPAGDGVTVVDRLDGDSVRVLNLAIAGEVSDFCLTHVWVGRLAALVEGECRSLDDFGVPLARVDSCSDDWGQ